MNIEAVPTEIVTNLEGVPVRLWKARTETGVEFLMFVHRVAVPDDGRPHAEFEQALQEMPAPVITPAAQVFSMRHIW